MLTFFKAMMYSTYDMVMSGSMIVEHEYLVVHIDIALQDNENNTTDKLLDTTFELPGFKFTAPNR